MFPMLFLNWTNMSYNYSLNVNINKFNLHLLFSTEEDSRTTYQYFAWPKAYLTPSVGHLYYLFRLIRPFSSGETGENLPGCICVQDVLWDNECVGRWPVTLIVSGWDVWDMLWLYMMALTPTTYINHINVIWQYFP